VEGPAVSLFLVLTHPLKPLKYVFLSLKGTVFRECVRTGKRNNRLLRTQDKPADIRGVSTPDLGRG
jgi:hypothetical protein